MNVYMNYPDILTIKSAVVQVLFANLAKTEPEDRYPPGKRLHNYGKSPFYSWVNQ